jgi:hypothetical protein
MKGMSILLALSSARVFSPRLLELERVLARDRDAASANSATVVDPVAHHLGSVRAERIRRYTAALRSSHSPDTGNDDVDLLTMRLLLDEFVTAVRHLRGVTDMAATTVDAAAKPVHESHKFIKREEKREERKRLAATHATDRP